MERLLKFLHKLWNRAQPGLKRAFLLPPKVIAVLVPTTMVLCIAALNTQGKHPVLEMLIYLASAYALAVLVAGLGSITEAAARLLHGSRVYRWAQSNTIARLFISDFRFRGELSLYQGLAVSTLFAVFKGVTAVLYRSAWLGAVAVYYISFGVNQAAACPELARLSEAGERGRPPRPGASRKQAVRLSHAGGAFRNDGNGGSAYYRGAYHRLPRLGNLHYGGVLVLPTDPFDRESGEVPAAEQPGAFRFKGAEFRGGADVGFQP